MSSREPPRVLPFRSRLRDDKDLDSGQTYDPPAEHLISTVMPSKIHPNPQELIKRSLIWPGVLSPRERTFKAQATLPTEILELIFEELQKSSSLANVRLVSVQFNEIATPIAYRQVTLTDQILASFSLSKYLFDHTISQLRVAHDVRFYTRHISIDRCLDKDLLKELLRSMKDIRNVT